MIEIHNDVVDKLKLWNTHVHKSNRNLDGRFALAIFLSLTTYESIVDGKIDQEVESFIRGEICQTVVINFYLF